MSQHNLDALRHAVSQINDLTAKLQAAEMEVVALRKCFADSNHQLLLAQAEVARMKEPFFLKPEPGSSYAMPFVHKSEVKKATEAALRWAWDNSSLDLEPYVKRGLAALLGEGKK